MARYLVTGGAGFIGSHVVDALVAAGHGVRVLDDLSSGKLQNLDQVRGRVEFLQGDIVDRSIVERATEGVDFVIHEAAWRSVPKSMTDPVGYAEVNVVGTAKLLEAAVKSKVKRFVCVSSSSVYGETDRMPLQEDMPCRPISPYAASKLCDEVLCGLFWRAYRLEALSLRYFNVFGPRQSLENEYAVVVPKFISCLLRKESPPVYGDGKQSRDFTYVDNVAQATILASQTPSLGGEALNVALGEEHSVLDLLSELNKIMGLEIPPSFRPPRAGDMQRTYANPAKAQRLLKWQGSVPFVEGLRRTVAWFREHPPF